MTAPYCTPCLDVWCIQTTRLERGDWVNIWPGVAMHVTCGRALDAIANSPREYEELRSA